MNDKTSMNAVQEYLEKVLIDQFEIDKHTLCRQLSNPTVTVFFPPDFLGFGLNMYACPVSATTQVRLVFQYLPLNIPFLSQGETVRYIPRSISDIHDVVYRCFITFKINFLKEFYNI